MKALSLWQPWASAIAVGAKRNETRSWPATSGGQGYRGWVAICAALTQKDPKTKKPLSDTFLELLEHHENHALFADELDLCWDTLPFGKVVAVGWLRDCAQTDGLQVTAQEARWGDYSPGRYTWVFSEVWRINEPFPVRGEQKLFDVAMPANWQDASTRVF